MDGKGRPIQTTNAKQQTTKLGWDDDNNVTRLEEPPATTGATPAVSTWKYDPNTGYPTETKDAEAVKNGWDGTTLTYQTGLSGHIADLIAKKSPEGRLWTFSYSAEGNLSTVTDPIGNATATDGDYTATYTYDTWGQLETATDANGHTTRHSEFGASGYPQKMTDPLGNVTAFEYDMRGNVTKLTDARGKTTTQGYDEFSRSLENRSPKDQAAGEYIVTAAPLYDPNDNVLRQYAPNGAAATATYDAVDQVTDVVEPEDEPGDPERRTTYAYDKNGNLTSETEPKGNLTDEPGDYTTTYGYDEIESLTSVVNAKGHKLSYVYDDAGNVTTLVDPRKNATPATGDYTTKYTYDLAHRVTATTNAAGGSRQTGYDRDGLAKSTTDEDGNVTLVTLNARGNPAEVRIPHRKDGDNVVYRTTRYEYDQVGKRTKIITPRGVATADDPDDFVQQIVYDELGRVKEEIYGYDADDPRYNRPDRTIRTYDAVGNLTKVSSPPSSGETVRNDTAYTHFDNGWIKTSRDPWDITTSYEYDALGQQTKNTLTGAGGSPGRTMSWTYFPDGKPRTRTDDGVPVGGHSVLVDNSDFNNARIAGTWTASTQGEGLYGPSFHTKPAGDGSGRFQWGLNIPQSGDYEVFVRYPDMAGAAPDAEFRIDHKAGTAVKTIDQTSAPGQWVSLGRYQFDESGTHQVVLTDKATAGTTVVADSVKLVRDNSGDADTERKQFEYRYDPNANLISITDSGPGAKIDNYAVTYTSLNQVAKVEERLNGVLKNATSFTYDENGQPKTQKHDREYASFEYDVRDLPARISHADSESDPTPKLTTFTYTARGQRLHQVKGNGNTVDFGYHLDGLVRQQTEKKADGTVVSEHTLDYDPNGQRSRDVGRKLNADAPGSYLTTTADYTYDPRDRVARVVKTGAGAGTETYVHDANNNVIEQTVKDVTTTYSYDRNRLLTSASGGVVGTYNYDPFGRVNTVTAAGQVIERNKYDGFDRIIEKQSQGGTGGLSTTRYTYDPLDRTSSKTTGVGGANEKTTTYHYLGLSAEVLTEESAGEITKSYQHSPWGERLSQVKHGSGTGEDGYYGYNAHGDVETLTDPAGGTKATYGYTAYGSGEDAETTGIDKPDPQNPTKEPYNPYRFNAKRWDSASRDYDMGFRDYDPGLNRFLTRDMYTGALDDLDLGTDPWTSNRYAFAGGNPINLIELDGHDPHGCAPTDDAASRACHERGRQVYYAERAREGLPNPGGVEKLNNPDLSNPPPGTSPEQVNQAAGFILGASLSTLAAHLQKMSGAQRGNFTVLLSRVTVQTSDGPVPRVVAFTSQSGLPKDLERDLTRYGVTIYKAPGAPSGSTAGHAEQAAANFRANVAQQIKDLGGRIISVHTAFTTSRICSRQCEGNINKFIGDPAKSVKMGSNGMVEGTQVTGQLLKNLRSAFGLSGRTATWVTARSYWGGMFSRGSGGRGSGGGFRGSRR
ncbi:hypothetical protein E1287_34920 [Actinomadura sp. KC06]|uniref:golvesin C-terminal-like domain-containing protein n=1 Tax=Actinomadura sp. KC06 TaxID=2530369 RepID=UPI001043F3A0|nr:RHS repeat-associated core domain-containing protein [Actinomadura sp. KC06]TDD27270.1 hypothetical protein E1287_34920 [Actinomadura sp. KC06]